jgi:hypothetical protein
MRGTSGTVPYRPATGPIRVDVVSLTKDLANERALRSHRALELELAKLAQQHGFAPLSPIGDPQSDVAWRDADGTLAVAAVKSLPEGCETQQLRLGLGQVCDYRAQLQARGQKARAVLAVERQSAKRHWQRACADAEVPLAWHGRMHKAFG